MPTSSSTKLTRISFPVYQDYSTKDDVWIESQLASMKMTRKSFGGAKSQFPLILFNMLHDVEVRGMSDIVGWLPHGRAFKIYNRELFESRILPFYFANQSEFSSFQRQLCLYGYMRLVGKHAEQGAVYHEYFLRGRVDLCRLIYRQRVLPSKRRRVFDPKSEPKLGNFPPMAAIQSGASLLPPSPLELNTGIYAPCPSDSIRPWQSDGLGVRRQDASQKLNNSPLHRDNYGLVRPTIVVQMPYHVPPNDTSAWVPGNLRRLTTLPPSHIDVGISDENRQTPLLEPDRLDGHFSSKSPASVSLTSRPNSGYKRDVGKDGAMPDVFIGSACSGPKRAVVSKWLHQETTRQPRVAILGLTEYLETFREAPLVDDQSILSETDISRLTHQSW